MVRATHQRRRLQRRRARTLCPALGSGQGRLVHSRSKPEVQRESTGWDKSLAAVLSACPQPGTADSVFLSPRSRLRVLTLWAHISRGPRTEFKASVNPDGPKKARGTVVTAVRLKLSVAFCDGCQRPAHRKGGSVFKMGLKTFVFCRGVNPRAFAQSYAPRYVTVVVCRQGLSKFSRLGSSLQPSCLSLPACWRYSLDYHFQLVSVTLSPGETRRYPGDIPDVTEDLPSLLLWRSVPLRYLFTYFQDCSSS